MAKPIGFTGYYPGEKIPRAPGGGRPKPYIPNEYDLNAFSDTINDMYFNLGDVPGFVADQLSKGLKISFGANLYARNLKAEELQGYSEGEISEEKGELSGVKGFSINLDPRDIAKDPEKWAKKIPTQIWSELTSWKDLELKKRENLWAGIVGIPTGNGFGADYRVMKTLETKEVFSRMKEVPPQESNPLNLASLKTAGGEEIGLGTARAIVDFESNIRSAFFRDDNFDTVLQKALAGTSTALKEGLKTGRISNEPITVDGVTFTGQNADKALSIIGEAELATHLANFGSNADSNANTLGSVIARLNQEVNPLDKKGDPLDLSKTVNGIKGDINKARAHMQMLTDGTGSLSTEQRTLLGEEAVKIYEEITTGPILDREAMLALTPQLKAFNKSLDALEKSLEGPLPTTWLGRNALLQRVSTATTSIKGGDALRHGVERSLLKKVVGGELVGGKKINGRELKRIEDLLVPGSEEHIYVRNLRILLPTLERDRTFFAVDDFVDTFYKDNVLSAFLWTAEINPRLRVFTPAYYVSGFMKRMNYFGLVIDEKTLQIGGNDVNPKFFLYKAMNKIIKENKIFANTFGISVLGKKTFVRGGDHFGVVKDLQELLEKNGDLLKKLLENPEKAKEIILEFAEGDSPLAELLREKFGKDPEKWATEFAEKFKKFHDWLKENASKIGIDLNNSEHVRELLTALMKYDLAKIKTLGIGITRSYRGIMEHFAQKLSILQNKIFKGVLGKIAGKIIGWKMVVSHAFAVAVTTALAALTGGTSSFISGAIEKVVQFVSRIFLDAAEKIFVSIIKADFAEFYKFTEKSLYNLLKWFAYAFGAIGGVMTLLTMIIMMVIIGSISALDNTKIGAIGNGEGSGGGSGETGPILPNIAPGTCTHEVGTMTTPSYGYIGPGNYDTGTTAHMREGHGGNPYWGDGSTCIHPDGGGVLSPCVCAYRIPGGNVWPGAVRSHSASTTAAVCYSSDSNQRSSYFGMAADFIPIPRNDMAVYLPALGEAVDGNVTWSSIAGPYNSGRGSGIVYRRNDGTHTYIMLILHVNYNAQATGSDIPAGTHIGSLWDCWRDSGRTCGTGYNTHTHVEITVDGTPIRPESVLCL